MNGMQIINIELEKRPAICELPSKDCEINSGNLTARKENGSNLTENRNNLNAKKEHELDEPPRERETCFPTRYLVIITAFFAYILGFIMRANLSVAIVRMVNSSNSEASDIHHTEACHYSDNNTGITINTDNEGGEFDWNEKTQGLVLSAFVCTFGFGGLFGGRLGDLLGAKKILAIGIGFMSVLTLLTQGAAYLSVYALVVVRLLEGFLAGMAMPTMNTIVSRWMPKSERSIGCSILLGGTRFGNVLGLLLTGLLCKSDTLGGWPLTFYVFGGAGVLWTFAWLLVMYETPSEHPRISRKELEYILTGQDKIKKKAKLPYRKLLTSIPVWATVCANVGESWGMATLPVTLPLYFSHILHFDVALAGILTAVPSMLQAIFMWCSGFLGDYILSKQWASRTVVRKIMNSLGQIAAACLLISTTFVGCNRIANVFLFTLTMGINGCVAAGFRSSVVDMAPDYAGTIMGISMFVANTIGFVSPYIVGILTNGQQTLKQWHIIFYINAGFYAFGGICFLLGGSSDLQPWGISPEEDPTTEEPREIIGEQEEEVY